MKAPSSRELRNPYFLLRTPDGLGSYIKRDCMRLIQSEREPLSAFLAPVATSDEGKGGKIEYRFDALPIDTLEQASFVPEPQLEAFEKAVDAFLDKAKTERISDHEQRLRNHFRLPDPDLEPDAYWLYGPVDDRRLLILWGCEFRQNSSLPLRGNGGAPGVLEKLRARKASWRQQQDSALQLIRDKQLPLAPFLASATTGASGSVDGYLVEGRKLPAEECNPAKRLPANSMQAFQKAVEAFYARALPDSPASDYEKSLITSFQLPDPSRHPDRYRLHKDRFFIVLDGKETESDCLYPGSDQRLGIPPKFEAEDGTTMMPDTVLDKLGAKAKKPANKPLYAGLAAAVLVAAVVAFILLGDRSPPELVEIRAVDDPEWVDVVFSEGIHEDSLQPAEDGSQPFRIRHERGHFLDVLESRIAANDSSIVQLRVEPLEERNYTLNVRNVTDRSRARNVFEGPVDRNFLFRDTIPPEIEHISAHPENPRGLVIRFSKELDPGSASNPNAFRIPGFTTRSANLMEDGLTVQVETEERFEHRREYTLEVRSIRDASRERNEIAEGTSIPFEYVDTIPPTIERVAAESNQVTVRVFFNKTIQRARAESPGNYQILQHPAEDPEAVSALEIEAVRLLPDDRTVDLITAPMANGIQYQLIVSNIRDRADPPNTLEESEPVEFQFRGQMDTRAPQVRTVRMSENAGLDVLQVTFDKPVRESTALNPLHYTLLDSHVTIEEVEPTGDPSQYVLTLSEPLAPTDIHRLIVEAVEDHIGNRIDGEHQSPRFSVPGVSIPPNEDVEIESVRVSSDGQRVSLAFAIPLVQNPAGNLSNYQFSGNNRVQSIELDPEDAPTEITLTLDPETPIQSGSHQLRVRNQRLEWEPEVPQADAVKEFQF
ncbi:MAG: hypothetical protein JJU20_01895 [Opitutales bacterium]|nr:hypothetical protein [Opitutales bacterium]